MVPMGLQLRVHVPQKGGVGRSSTIYPNRRIGSGMIDSVSKFSLNGTNSNGVIRKPLLMRFSQTGKKWKNLGQVSFKI